MNKHAYSVRYVHKISPSEQDKHHDIELDAGDLVDAKSLAKALRAQGALAPGGRIISYRAEGNGQVVVVFPAVPGLTTYWHCIVLMRKATADYRG